MTSVPLRLRFRKKLDGLEMPAGYRAQMRGEVSSMQESFQSLTFGMVLAAVLIYLVLVAQFRSFLDPFIIMFAVPLGLIGVIWILLLTGTTLNIQSFMGMIFMVGIAVSNSILLVDFSNRLMQEGVPLLGAFGFDFPIYTGGRIKNEIIEAQANVEKAQAARAELAQDIRFQVQRAYNELVSAGESVRGTEQVVRQAREALRLAQARYRAQVGSLVELTTAETAASGAEAQYAESLYNYKVAEAKLNYVTGRPYRP